MLLTIGILSPRSRNPIDMKYEVTEDELYKCLGKCGVVMASLPEASRHWC